MEETASERLRVPTGIAGLDQILRGGLLKERVYLVHGAAGAGKTTLAFQFLFEGHRVGERVLYVTLLQDAVELEDMAASHGWSLDGIDIVQLPSEVRGGQRTEQTVFSPADIELTEAVDAILQGIEKHQPERVVIDSISELAILVDNGRQLRRQILRLKSVLECKQCTALITAGDASENLNAMLTLVHGSIGLSMQIPDYGPPRRRLTIPKMRAMDYAGGTHDCRIGRGGLEVFPRLEAGRQCEELEWELVRSGVPELDELLGGGLEEGTSCLIAGSTGAGKSTLASLYLKSAAERGDLSVAFCFDERKNTYLRRSSELQLPIAEYIDLGLIDLQQVNVGELSAGEFARRVVRSVERDGARVVVIDSLTGYLNAMGEEHLFVTQLHELLDYLSSKGVLSIMLLATHGLFAGEERDIDASYLADTVVLACHFEAAGSLRQCLSVVKKRHGRHEHTIREFEIRSDGVRVGAPLRDFSGVLTGTPRFEGAHQDLLATEPGC